MEDSLEAMQLALRVLKSVNYHKPPDSQDVSELRRLAPEEGNWQIDELACAVIQNALDRSRKILAKKTKAQSPTQVPKILRDLIAPSAIPLQIPTFPNVALPPARQRWKGL